MVGLKGLVWLVGRPVSVRALGWVEDGRLRAVG